MVVKKPRIVIIGAGMAGLTAANKLYKSIGSKEAFELHVIEGGDRIGGRVNTSEFGGDRIEMGATWIHGIGGSPVYKIAQEINSMESEKPWECMDGFLDDNPITISENGYVLDSSLVDNISNLFNNLMAIAQGKRKSNAGVRFGNNMSVGSFLRKGVEDYWEMESRKQNGNKLIEEAIFAMNENIQRNHTAANDLLDLDYKAESEYIMCPGEEITIPKGYSSIIESLASILPCGVIQLGKKVCKIEWQLQEYYEVGIVENGDNINSTKPVKIHFLDGTTLSADHVIVTVSLGVLKAGITDSNDSSILKFNPPLPDFKIEAISRLGFGVVNKLFLQINPNICDQFPFLQFVFHQSKNTKIPWWIRKTAFMTPIYRKSRVLLSWFAGEEALKLETLSDEVILDQVSTTLSTFLSNSSDFNSHEHENGINNNNLSKVNIVKVLKSKWGSDPLFLGSYSYIAVGSSCDDMDIMAKPLPKSGSKPLQILFAGEATHRTHYSTTHGAYFSGIREANRLLEHYHYV